MQYNRPCKYSRPRSNSTPYRNGDRDLDRQTDILNNLDLEAMDICSKDNLPKMEQSEMSKLINDRAIIIKHSDKGGRAQ